MNLSERYSRQIILQGIGSEGQEKLRKGRVLVVGAGGLGSPALLYLAAAGVGTIGVIDDDFVSSHNLNRQILYCPNDINRIKVESAREKIVQFNPETNVLTFNKRLDYETARDIFRQFDIILDCTDNMETRMIINEVSRESGIPFVFGGAIKYYGQMMTIMPDRGPCLRCLISGDPSDCGGSCDREGILGPIVGIIGVLQALESIKHLTGLGELMVGRLLIVDGLDGDFDTVMIEPNSNCPVCGNRPKGEKRDDE